MTSEYGQFNERFEIANKPRKISVCFRVSQWLTDDFI